MSAKDYMRTYETTVDEFDHAKEFDLSEGQRAILDMAKQKGRKIKVTVMEYSFGRFLNHIQEAKD